MSVAPFEIESEEEAGGIRVLTVRGELDMETSPSLERQLDAIDAGSSPSLLVDLSGCEFIDSTAVALLVSAWRRFDADAGAGGEGRVALCAPGEQVRRVIEVTGLSDSIPVHGSREEAVAALAGGG